MNIISNSDTSILNARAIEAINTHLSLYHDTSILFLVSGGSALALLNSINGEFLHKNITISVLDERYSTDEAINNFSQLITTNFYQSALQKGCKFIDTRPKDETLEEITSRFESALKIWKKNNPSGVILITQGIGPDGHTSGIMPFPEDPNSFHELFENDNWVTGYDARNKNQYPLRITTTITFLRSIVDISIVYACGENKKEALTNVLREGSLTETPGRVIKQMKNVMLLTDLSL